MPIYAYKCSSCGYAKDVLQKISDAPLTDCPECGKSSFAKQVTAAGFQLKGSGWYVTDFRNNSSGNSATGKAAPSESSSAGGESASSASAPASAPAAPATSSAPT
ncbi:FmdB family zinc ribbon protein [Bordetella hinzii]|uniref:FmdB family transcriptional regulator n=2 Tax=Bordetella hinzii TaxID=103855 RepID=A0AAN1RV48_9BORD|nr:FmdB family zinc ribbon protein [Bordetella hinzii]AKQ53492.1 Zinc ribbon domain protein [Bordetella hinzii]AKQ58053.1 Zinc ribbon domain protein [Bordetella hinzii]AZW16593.1 FmdB family transcriptional regulator [Bordetella hinzii]KCB23137.1 regulatory protein, FmdB family [Bordetella hinzii OH87 BAL007II]KCB29456.1 regulatory protein, FmdB family [Bordetella hinzii L60]